MVLKNRFRKYLPVVVDIETGGFNPETNAILEILKPILSEYSKKNSISMVLQKQNVVIGKKELDITKDIILILDEKIKKIDIN